MGKSNRAEEAFRKLKGGQVMEQSDQVISDHKVIQIK